MREFDLEREAKRFAGEVKDVINRTIAEYVNISAVVTYDGTVVVGKGVTPRRFLTVEPFRLRRAEERPLLDMKIQYVLQPDDQEQYLQVNSSIVVVSSDGEDLFHVDYERNKADEYPEAHLQVCATSPAWERVLPHRQLARLHLPVGGRRFRPTFEDVADFLITEKLVSGAEGWREVLDAGRRGFMEKQLRAAIRRHPEIARAAVAELD